MKLIKTVVALVLLVAIAGCARTPSKFLSYNGPEVTEIQVHKGDRKLYLLHGTTVLRAFDVKLGFAPTGHKSFEGDGRTPEGAYYINFRNPKSRYHLALQISYPNDADRAFALAAGKEPGGDIFIHGRTNYKGINKDDWTAGCIAVTDPEMEIIYSMVKTNTPIFVLP